MVRPNNVYNNCGKAWEKLIWNSIKQRDGYGVRGRRGSYSDQKKFSERNWLSKTVCSRREANYM